MTDRELKPCPFCGGEAEFSRDGEYHVLRCKSCRAEHADEIKRKAVERWNTRAALRPEAQEGVASAAHGHAVNLEQCSVFARDAGKSIEKAMLDAAAFLRALSQGGK